MMPTRLRSLWLIVALVLIGGPAEAAWWWPFETVYVWTRSDGDIFRLRLSMDADHRLVLLEEFTPSPRSTAVVPVAATTIRDYYHKCDFFDARNFLCFSAAGEFDYVEMRDGTLTHHYWNTLRTYLAEVRLAW